jgi:hypothetical protein
MKDIPGFEGRYKATKSGLIVSYTKGYPIEMKPRICKATGYSKINLFKNGKRITYNVHQLIMQTFKGEQPKGFHVDHVDHDKQNNSFDNLQYLSARDNTSKSALKMKKSGLPIGVTKGYKKYRSMIRFKRKRYKLIGRATIQEASEAYQRAKQEIKDGIFDPSIYKELKC